MKCCKNKKMYYKFYIYVTWSFAFIIYIYIICFDIYLLYIYIICFLVLLCMSIFMLFDFKFE